MAKESFFAMYLSLSVLRCLGRAKWLGLLLFVGLTSANAANWYVDNAASGANNGTSWANAWTSFPSVVWGANGVKAGDTLFISGGTSSKTYRATANRLLNIGAAGTSEGNRLTVRVGQDPGHNGMVIFEGSWTYGELIYGGGINYVTIDGSYNGDIHWKCQNITTNDAGPANPYGGVVVSGTQVRLKYIEIAGCNAGIAFFGSGGELANCYLHDVRETVGISFGSCNNGAKSYDLTFMHNNRLELNNKRYTGAGPDGIQGCPGLTIYSNYFGSVSGPLGPNPQHQDFIQAQAHYVKMYQNTFENITDSGIDVDGNYSAGNLRIYNNVFKMNFPGLMPSGIRIYTSQGPVTNLSDVWICNNTFLDWGIGVGGNALAFGWGNGTTPVVQDVHIKNNLFYNCGLGNGWPVVNVGVASTLNFADWDFDYNLLNGGAHGNTVINLGGKYVTQQNGFYGVPAFASYSEGSPLNDCHLLTTDTAARNKGVNLSTIFNTDKDGVLRPAAPNAWDIGAHQVGAAPINQAPTVSGISTGATDVDANTTGLQVYEGTSATYTASASDPNGDVLSWQWVYTANGGTETIYSSGTGAVAPLTVNYPVGSAGTQYIWTLRVSDAQSTSQSQITTGIIAAPPVSDPYGAVASLDATAGTISAPMISADGSVYQGFQTSLADSGRVAYSFNVPTNSDYMVMCVVDAPSDAANSLFINIDSEPQDPYMVWHISPTIGFKERYVGWQGNGTWDKPQLRGVVFPLTAGAHQLIIRGREAGVKISKVYVIPKSAVTGLRPIPPTPVSAILNPI